MLYDHSTAPHENINLSKNQEYANLVNSPGIKLIFTAMVAIPGRNILSSGLANRTSCTIEFEGDVFETEYQRNWTDASFKTYSTPLSIPFPVLIEKGTRTFLLASFRRI